MNPVLFPNVGAEAPSTGARAEAFVRPVRARFVRLLSRHPPPAAAIPSPAAVAWFNDAAAEAFAKHRGLPLYGAPADRVRAVHDKAFAIEAARALGLEPCGLADHVFIVEPDALAHTSSVLEVERWTRCAYAAGAERFVLKPRLGCSGRGFSFGPALSDKARRRLSRAGGAIVEPWLERIEDLTAVFAVDEASVRKIGSLIVETRRGGAPRAHRARVDDGGRIRAPSPHVDAFEDAAGKVVARSWSAGFRGMCGVDGFVFRHGGREVLRPVCELNARFTVGALSLFELQRAGCRGAMRVDLEGRLGDDEVGRA